MATPRRSYMSEKGKRDDSYRCTVTRLISYSTIEGALVVPEAESFLLVYQIYSTTAFGLMNGLMNTVFGAPTFPTPMSSFLSSTNTQALPASQRLPKLHDP